MGIQGIHGTQGKQGIHRYTGYTWVPKEGILHYIYFA